MQAVADGLGQSPAPDSQTLTVNASKNFATLAKLDVPGASFKETDGRMQGTLTSAHAAGCSRDVHMDVRDQAFGKGFDEEYKTALDRLAKTQEAFEVAVSTPHQWMCGLCPAVGTHVAAPVGKLLCGSCASDPEVRAQIVLANGPLCFLKLYF